MKYHLADSVGGDAYPASQPQAVNDAKPVVQPLAPRPDYTQVEPSNEPETYNWVVVGKDQVMIHPVADHQLMLEMSNHSHFSRPHAKGILHLFDNWDAEFELLSSNVSLTVVTKALKKAAKKYGWNFKALIDESGMPYLEKTGADFGVGPNNPGVKDWMNKEWAGTDQFDQMPPPGWDDAPDESELKSGPYSCQDCDQTFADYGQWREHTIDEHTKSQPELGRTHEPWVDMDASLPAHFVDWQRKQDQLGVTAMALNPDAFAKYPKVIDGADISRWVPGCGLRLNGLTLTLMTLPVAELANDTGVTPMSGDQWQAIEGEGHPRSEWTQNYSDLESTIADAGDMPPIVVERKHLGRQTQWYLVDGFHRLALAQHLGLKDLPAYVFDQTTPEGWAHV